MKPLKLLAAVIYLQYSKQSKSVTEFCSLLGGFATLPSSHLFRTVRPPIRLNGLIR